MTTLSKIHFLPGIALMIVALLLGHAFSADTAAQWRVNDPEIGSVSVKDWHAYQYYKKANEAYDQKNYQQAVEYYQSAVRFKRVKARSYHNMGHSYHHLKQPQAAADAYRQAILSWDRKKEAYEYAQSHFFLALKLITLKQYQQAEEALRVTAQLNPNSNSKAQELIADAKHRLELIAILKKMDATQKDIEAISNSIPNPPKNGAPTPVEPHNIAYNSAIAHINLGKYDLAMKDLITLFGNSDVRVNEVWNELKSRLPRNVSVPSLEGTNWKGYFSGWNMHFQFQFLKGGVFTMTSYGDIPVKGKWKQEGSAIEINYTIEPSSLNQHQSINIEFLGFFDGDKVAVVRRTVGKTGSAAWANYALLTKEAQSSGTYKPVNSSPNDEVMTMQSAR